MDKRKKIFILIVTCLYCVYYWVIPGIINKNIPKIKQKIQQTTGINIVLEKPYVKMGHLPAVWFMSENFAILNENNSKALNLEHMAVKINLIPLIFGKIQIGNFSSDKIEINIIRSPKGELKLGQYLLPKTKNFPMTLSKAYFRLGNYIINLDDQKLNKKFSIYGTYLTLDEFKNDKKIKFSTYANLFVDKKRSDIMADVDIKLPLNKITENQFKINGRISNLNLADFSDYVKISSNNKIENLSGNLDLIASTHIDLNNTKKIFSILTVNNLNISQAQQSIYSQNELRIETLLETVKNGLNIKNIELKSNNANANINGFINQINSLSPIINANINIDKSRVEKFIPFLPPETDLLEEINFLALKKYPLFGNIEGNLQIAGNYNRPDINGNIKITDGYLIKPVQETKSKATINLNFDKDKVYIDANIPTNTNHYVTAKGYQELYENKSFDLKVNSTSKINLKTAQSILVPLHEILKFDVGPIPIMKITGHGNADLHIKGTRKNPRVWGIFNFYNTFASFNDIHNVILQNASGELKFDDENTYFYTKSAKLNGLPIGIKGTCTLKGELNYNVKAYKQNLNNLIKTIKNSPLLENIAKLIEPIQSASGYANLDLNLTGKITDVNEIVFDKNLFANGKLELLSNIINIKNIPLSNTTGQINFENLNANINLQSFINNSKLNVNGLLNNDNADLKISSEYFVLKDCIKLLKLNIPFTNDINKIATNFIINYKGNATEINSQNINVKGLILKSNGQNIKINETPFEVVNGNLKPTIIKGFLNQSPFNVHLSANNILSEKQSLNGTFNFDNINLNELNNSYNRIIKNLYGKISLNGEIRHNDLFANVNIKNVEFLYIPENMKVKLPSGKIQIKKDTIFLNKINSTIGEMPVFADGKISNIDKKPYMNLYINAKPTQEFIDHFFNNKAVYPLKIKGDINCASNIFGTFDAIHNKTQLKLAENASIYYMGATLGSNLDNHSSILFADNIIYPDGITINNFQYDKLIPSQNNTPYNKIQLIASGKINFLKDNNVKFNNLKIKTHEPTDAKIFNIIFRKPFMKQGIFTSDIIINGTATEPNILGKLNITSIDIPLFDAVINDIDLNFKKDKIYLNSKGIILTNSLNVSSVIKNSSKLPIVFEDIKFNIENLDINKITETLREYDLNKTTPISQSNLPDLSQIIINNSEIKADNIKIKNLEAKDFISHITLNDKMQLEVKDFEFKMAEGKVNGNIKYNLLNHVVDLSMNMLETNAQIIAETLFDLKGQIFGIITGNINLYCNSKSQDLCTQTLFGNGYFNVTNGKMPKLGSLEYLLKAGNLVKSGFTGLSINGIIDLITPHKTGNFESIKGNFKITEGIANNIEIFSDGKELNIYMKGNYNFTNLNADMQVFGNLTKNFSTGFGKIANASLNTLFNTIPGINLSQASNILSDDIKKIPNYENSAKMFKAEIYGDINGENYVKSFKWLK